MNSSNGRSFENSIQLVIDIPKEKDIQDNSLIENHTDCLKTQVISRVSECLDEVDRWDIDLTAKNYSITTYDRKDKVRLYDASISGQINTDISSAIEKLLVDIAQATNSVDLVQHSKIKFQNLLYLWSGYSFEAYDVEFVGKSDGSEFELMRSRENFRFKGRISKKKIEEIAEIDPFDSDETEVFIQQMKGGSKREEVVQQIPDEVEQATFLFIRSLQDYGNTAPSEVFISELLDLQSKYPFLFQPDSEEWDTLLEMSDGEREKILKIILNRISGLLRRSFEGVIGDWIAMIRYLRDRCNGDPRTFFEQIANELGVNTSDPDALEKVQSKIEKFDKEDARDRIGIQFSFSKKIGRLLFTLMTKNERGYDLLNGVSRDQVENFNLPVDAQIIRVTLNLGLLKIETTAKEDVTFEASKDGKKEEVTKEGIELQRSDLDQVCRRVWQELAAEVSRAPAELDHILWSVGSTLGNRRGALCMTCPLGSVCDAWKQKEIYEAGGSQWNDGGYTFARAHTDRDKMIILEEWHPFKVETYTEEQPRLTFNNIEEVLSRED
ncbi:MULTISPECIES: hypothetical protein [Halomicrobium]|uniref:Uncharacterized protein n=2 Tax=Halomicrobium mukohataei TaxID=57705 RepID=C7NXZ7_HALMD|nr:MULTISPECIES: hypothetical protein [Halomicrobium]ACV46585.1 hypothetical protein Hmuk_0451 [Halomicrobium mukohataei DSM 12286]QCD65125.1 hypothetical protein E5139_05515 [Halomicrobium mukohataei]QFR19931.1 hypothetical protein GBQ70_05510 [Halomicrobium sp. ZPS1]